jgi:23S rRNA (cytidine1920-2'-O)/16S rRNA (cytidine1409-2'-O)-methyltransferase
MTRRRLDAELARRGLARSREHAQGLIADGSVAVRGVVSLKPATLVGDADAIVVRGAAAHFVSRGAMKLIGALDACDGLILQGRRALDAGASTGGFTEVLLQRAVAGVLAVDVGYGQLAWSLRQDPRVVVIERTNVRYLSPADLPWVPDLVVADLSFISLRTVLPALLDCSAARSDYLLLVKPQFEVGREHICDGVVRDVDLRRKAVTSIAHALLEAGLELRGVVASPLPGPRGNVEYFIWAERGSSSRTSAHADSALGRARDMIDAAIQRGPS